MLVSVARHGLTSNRWEVQGVSRVDDLAFPNASHGDVRKNLGHVVQ
jgi:hypothetical protein